MVGPSERREAPAIVFGLEPPPNSGSRQLSIASRDCRRFKVRLGVPNSSQSDETTAYVRVEPAQEDAEHEMTVVRERVDQGKLDGRRDDGDGGRLDTETDKAHDHTVGVLEPSLRLPQDAHEGRADEDVRDDGADEPEAGKEVTDVVECLVVNGLMRDEGQKRRNGCKR